MSTLSATVLAETASGVAGDTTVASEFSVFGDWMLDVASSKALKPVGAWMTDCGSSLAESDRALLGSRVLILCRRSYGDKVSAMLRIQTCA